jgi:hypothetical protein
MMEDHLVHHGQDSQMWVWKRLGEKGSSNDEWEYACKPHRTQFPQGAIIDENFRWEDMFHDAFVAPTMDDNRDGGPLLYNQVAARSGATDGPCDVGTTIQVEEPLAMMSIKHVQC